MSDKTLWEVTPLTQLDPYRAEAEDPDTPDTYVYWLATQPRKPQTLIGDVAELKGRLADQALEALASRLVEEVELSAGVHFIVEVFTNDTTNASLVSRETWIVKGARKWHLTAEPRAVDDGVTCMEVLLEKADKPCLQEGSTTLCSRCRGVLQKLSGQGNT